ncbi:hypothetical protein Q4603_18315 [Zobellia galactanivorans]|uniref:Hypothetical lipoprotein n=1 Tax=Zobellia galactanivorans (strain DSM 12802 / CCUG 47099 / CIP 106680 / NCIMB 13871 / Dsij) TaxID=63186 RepID=G0LCN9_ZOBGA|nr:MULTISPECIES: hypothetical protein [Zobellia]MBU3025164.1 hypothetical protein [Zobellia galactanivorans]MDO6810583.1 hypothetical protein [Zobellia galactanivorans]OWW25249.1 hypothetical protein B4Q04_11985 [Zobellia sp. OII3]CAZ97063.1 Hypothetical lipoprotein [Zobellia galactanivorans]
MKKKVLKYLLSLFVLLIGVCNQSVANSLVEGGFFIYGNYSNDADTVDISVDGLLQQAILSSSSTEKHRSHKVECIDSEEEESEPTVLKNQSSKVSFLCSFSIFYRTTYLFDRVKKQFSFYEHFTYLSTYKSLHLIFSVFRL